MVHLDVPRRDLRPVEEQRHRHPGPDRRRRGGQAPDARGLPDPPDALRRGRDPVFRRLPRPQPAPRLGQGPVRRRDHGHRGRRERQGEAEVRRLGRDQVARDQGHARQARLAGIPDLRRPEDRHGPGPLRRVGPGVLSQERLVLDPPGTSSGPEYHLAALEPDVRLHGLGRPRVRRGCAAATASPSSC